MAQSWCIFYHKIKLAVKSMLHVKFRGGNHHSFLYKIKINKCVWKLAVRSIDLVTIYFYNKIKLAVKKVPDVKLRDLFQKKSLILRDPP